ncbi:MAG: uroporphyrinogen-III synthase [Akkermansiaceae bacterium]
MSEELKGKRVVVTRASSQAGRLRDMLESRGADVLEIPTIKILPPQTEVGKREFVESVSHVHTYDWLVFTSVNGVEQFFEGFFKAYADARSLGGAKIAAVGASTAAKIKSYRYAVDLMPSEYVAEALVKEFADKESIENLTMMWVHGAEARGVIADGLTALGAIVDECIAYETVPETEDVTGDRKRMSEEGADYILFANGAGARNFFVNGNKLPEGCKIASIGKITSQALGDLGQSVDVEAAESTMESLVDAIC